MSDILACDHSVPQPPATVPRPERPVVKIQPHSAAWAVGGRETA